MIGIFHSLKVRLINFIPSPLVASSRLENGSSNKIKSGFVLSVRAKVEILLQKVSMDIALLDDEYLVDPLNHLYGQMV